MCSPGREGLAIFLVPGREGLAIFQGSQQSIDDHSRIRSIPRVESYLLNSQPFLVQILCRMSLTSLSCAIAASFFGAGAIVAQWSQSSNCLCDCSGGDQSTEVLGLLKSQLDRCGPEHLLHPPFSPEVVATAGFASWIVATIVLILVGVVAQWQRIVGYLLPFIKSDAKGLVEDARAGPRWSPPRGSRARLL